MPIELVCIDIDGTLTNGILGAPFAGVVEAVRRVRAALPVRFVTNATSVPQAQIAAHLQSLGVVDDPAHVITPISTARQVLSARGHDRGILIADPDGRDALRWFVEDPEGPAVLVSSEGHSLRIADLQPAVRRLLAGAHLYALEKNRYFRRADELVTDLGPLVAFFEYAAGRQAEVFGKPSALLFDAIAAAAGVARGNIAMVGDDAEFDAAASVGLGMTGVAVRTGKYRAGDAERLDPTPSAVLDSLADLPDWLGLA